VGGELRDQFGNPPSRTWEYYHDSVNAACVKGAAYGWYQILGTVCRGIEDGFRPQEPGINANNARFVISDTYLGNVFDDCIENDYTVGGVVMDGERRPVAAASVSDQTVGDPFRGGFRMRFMPGSVAVSGPDGRFTKRVPSDQPLTLRAAKRGFPNATSEQLRLAAGERKGGVVLTIASCIAVTGKARSQVLPEIPTMAEAGLRGVEMYTWQGMLAPAGTPREILDKLAGEIRKVLSLPETTARLASQGVTPFPSTPDQFTALLKSDTAKIAKIVKAANIKIEN
jgi:hypothetical protein